MYLYKLLISKYLHNNNIRQSFLKVIAGRVHTIKHNPARLNISCRAEYHC